MATEAPVLSRPLALHVSGLDPSTTEVDLYQFIAETQVPVQSIRIIRDEATKNPRYAYVNFSSVEDTEKVLQSLNYRQFKGREISFSHSIPQSHRIPQANLHVAGLPENTSSETLSNAFSIFGPIVSVRVGASKDGVRHNYGYVQFYSEATAAAAVEAASKGPIQIGSAETSLQVNVFKPASERVVKQTNVFVRNFPIAKGEQGFLETVKQFGTVTSTCFRSNCLNVTKTGPSETGFGFANYETTEQAEAALAELNKIQVDGFPLQAFFAKNKVARERELSDKSRSYSLSKANIYFKHVDQELPDQALEEYFRSVGEVLSLKFDRNETGARTGVCYVQYKSPEDAQAAMRQAHQRGWYADLHQSKDQRIQRQSNGYRRFAQNQNRGYMRQPRRNMHYRQHPQYPPHPHGGRMYQHPPRHMSYGMYPPRHHQGQHPRGPRQHHNGPRKQYHQPDQQQNAEEQRQKLGEQLYWQVEPIDATHAPQITGMLLDMPADEIYILLKDDKLLRDKVKEAQELLGSTAQTQ